MAQARGVTHSDNEEVHPSHRATLPVTEPLSILKRPTNDPSSASTDATDDFLSKSAVMLGLHRTTTGSSAGRTADRLSDTVLTLSTCHMEPVTTKCSRPCSGVQSLDTPAIIQDPTPKDHKKNTQGMTPYITPDGVVPSPVNQTIFWLDPSTGSWYQRHPDMGYCCVELTKDQAKQLVPHDQTPTVRVTESGLFPPIHSLSSIAQSALEPSASATVSTEPTAPAESVLADTVVVVTSSTVPTVRFNPLQTPVYDSTVLEEVSVPTSTVRPELPRPPKIKELVDVETPRVVTSMPKLAPLTTVTPSPQADKSRVSPYMQLPGVAGVDHFIEHATCLRCRETGSHALTCSLQYEYPVALILDRVSASKHDSTHSHQNPAIMGWSHTRIIQYVEWWPISFSSNLEGQTGVGICTKLSCSPLPFNAHWPLQLLCMATITPLLMRVKRNSCVRWQRHPRPRLILVGMSL